MSGSIKINYYDQFRCTADKCPFSCCQEWKIGVDNATYLKWEGKKLKGESKDLCHCVKRKPSGSVIALNKEKKCPFLNENKLCKVVLEFGEDYLSETCTTFPRQINEFEDRKEYSLDSGCPVVIDIMREQTAPVTFEEKDLQGTEGDLLMMVRRAVIGIMQQEEYTMPERMMMSFYVLLDLLEQDELSADKIAECESEKYLKPVVGAIRKMAFQTMDTLYESNELFLDVVENYRRQKLYVSYLEDVAAFAEQLEQCQDEDETIAAYGAFEKLFAEYENLVKHYMISEIFGSGLTEDMTLEDMVIVFQWISMEYAVMRQAVFLKWLMQEDRAVLEYSTVRDYVMIISRVTGYDQDDIREYLENSFEEVVWEWGYQALIIGNSRM